VLQLENLLIELEQRNVNDYFVQPLALLTYGCKLTMSTVEVRAAQDFIVVIPAVYIVYLLLYITTYCIILYFITSCFLMLCYITSLASCLIYAWAFPAHPYNM